GWLTGEPSYDNCQPAKELFSSTLQLFWVASEPSYDHVQWIPRELISFCIVGEG
ncbi:hypothetical protein U1Q18_025478, partial [Sarracenia purpurea var. burkii]